MNHKRLPTHKSCQELGLMGCVNRVLNALAAGVLVFARDTSVLLCNPRGAEIIGRPAEEITGRRVGEVLPDLRLPDLDDAASGSIRGELNFQSADGRRRTIGYQVTEAEGLEEEGSERQKVLLFQDVSDWVETRTERDRLLRLAAVGQTLPIVLHELKSPLAAISTSVELLIEEAPPGQLQTDLYAILSEVRRMRIGFDGIGAVGRDLRSTRHTAVDHEIRQVVQVLLRQANEAGIELQTEIPDLPLLHFDGAVMRAVVFNLVRNALDACQRGSVVDLQVNLEADGRVLRLQVADTGTGMTPEVLGRCRDLFYTTKSRGTGIGLALCRRAVESAGGTLEISSTVGQGTRVEVEIPVE